jgi:hypothetical protein
VPPTVRRVIIHSAPAWEKVGTRLFPHLGGVVLVEATKQIYAGTPVVATARRRRLYVPVAGSTERRSFDATAAEREIAGDRGLRAPAADAKIPPWSTPGQAACGTSGRDRHGNTDQA